MPKFYRQNKKKIDPRYFLNETTNRDLMEFLPGEHDPLNAAMPGPMEIMNSLIQYKQLICNNKTLFFLAIDHLSPRLAAKAIITKVKTEHGQDMPEGSEAALTTIIQIYQNNDKMKKPLKSAIDVGCNLPF